MLGCILDLTPNAQLPNSNTSPETHVTCRSNNNDNSRTNMPLEFATYPNSPILILKL